MSPTNFMIHNAIQNNYSPMHQQLNRNFKNYKALRNKSDKAYERPVERE